jgi:DNA-binding NarL/FixJ family response regulator
LLVDDHPMMRAGLAVTIAGEDDMHVVAEAGSGEEAVTLYGAHRPDVVLMDLRLPGLNGVQAIQAIRAFHAEARAIVITTYDGDEDICRALAAGARAYLLKDTLRRELVDAIRAVHRGERYMSPAAEARLAARTTELSPRETELLALVAQGRSNKEIAATAGLAEGTVRIHLSNIFEKLGVHDRTQAAIVAIQRGFVHLG